MMRSIAEIVKHAEERGISFPDAVVSLDSAASGLSAKDIREKMSARIDDMRRSVNEAMVSETAGKIIGRTGSLLGRYAASAPLSGPFITRASEIALDVATYNAAMGRIVAAPTAGSCGILPGLLFSWEEYRGGDDSNEKLTDALIIAGAIGEVIANRATLAGAEGGCQAECGAAAAMGAGALVFLQGGDAGMISSAVAITIKSILGLVCDPVGGLVECPCIKRNGTLVSIGAISADMALAGIESLIPADEVIDTMGQVGRSIPPTLRETSKAGLAVTPTAKRIMRELREGR